MKAEATGKPLLLIIPDRPTTGAGSRQQAAARRPVPQLTRFRMLRVETDCRRSGDVEEEEKDPRRSARDLVEEVREAGAGRWSPTWAMSDATPVTHLEEMERRW